MTASRLPVDLSARTRRSVLVVDDSAFMRRLVSDVVSATGEFDVVGTARDGEDALRQIAALSPDLVTLDVDMPGLDGLSALRRIMADFPLPVVMLSAGGSDGGAEATLRALEAGAVEFVRKPSGAISLDLELVGERLLEALRAASVASLDGTSRGAAMVDDAQGAVDARETRPLHLHTAEMVAARADGVPAHAPARMISIAASTGGPAALARVIPALPAFRDAAVVIAQHMPVGFTASFAKRLHAQSALRVEEAVHGAALSAGVVYIAPGGAHLRVVRDGSVLRAALSSEAPLWGVRPAADILFQSVAAVYGANAIGVVMTGMGCDGAAGLAAMRQQGAIAIVQNSTSCVIPGMPEAALAAAGADAVVPLDELAPAIDRAMQRTTQCTTQCTTQHTAHRIQ